MIGALIERHPRFATWLYGFTPPSTAGWCWCIAASISCRRASAGCSPRRLPFSSSVRSTSACRFGFALHLLLGRAGLAGWCTPRAIWRASRSASAAPSRCSPANRRSSACTHGGPGFDRPAILARHSSPVRTGGRRARRRARRGGARRARGAARLAAARASDARDALSARPVPRGATSSRLRVAWSIRSRSARRCRRRAPRRRPAPLRTQATGNDDFAGLRGYQPSDSPRHVAWKRWPAAT